MLFDGFFECIIYIHCCTSPLQLINKGKGEALRIRAILRSLVPTEDLVGIISIPLKMPIINKGSSQPAAGSIFISFLLYPYLGPRAS